MMEKKRESYFAAVGDVHGHMHAMLRMLVARVESLKIDLSFVLQVGDFEPIRHEQDLATMAGPAKYKKLGDFPDFYNRRADFPWPLYFIGGNHEPYGLLDQIPAGGEIAPNCYYLGRAGMLQLSELKIVGLSGIYREDAFNRPRPDLSLFGKRSNKDFSYFNRDDIDCAINYQSADILMLHEWPSDIVDYQDEDALGRPRHGSSFDSVGNEYSRLVLEILAPSLVICGHMHKRYRNRLKLAGGKAVQVCCLTNVQGGENSISIFKVTEDRRIVELIK